MKVMGWFVLPIVAACLSAVALDARADGQVIEEVKTYAISGRSGAELYASIGQHGPKAGVSRAIALTNFKLTWSRNYQPSGGGCTLVSARPKLVLTYTLPKPAGKLPANLQKRWDVFIEGVRRHEKVHGDIIKDMVATIEATTIGLSVPNDPKCQKIRKEIIMPLSAASNAQRQKSREFDRLELGNGGNVHQLILDLVNGG